MKSWKVYNPFFIIGFISFLTHLLIFRQVNIITNHNLLIIPFYFLFYYFFYTLGLRIYPSLINSAKTFLYLQPFFIFFVIFFIDIVVSFFGIEWLKTLNFYGDLFVTFFLMLSTFWVWGLLFNHFLKLRKNDFRTYFFETFGSMVAGVFFYFSLFWIHQMIFYFILIMSLYFYLIIISNLKMSKLILFLVFFCIGIFYGIIPTKSYLTLYHNLFNFKISDDNYLYQDKNYIKQDQFFMNQYPYLDICLSVYPANQLVLINFQDPQLVKYTLNLNHVEIDYQTKDRQSMHYFENIFQTDLRNSTIFKRAFNVINEDYCCFLIRCPKISNIHNLMFMNQLIKNLKNKEEEINYLALKVPLSSNYYSEEKLSYWAGIYQQLAKCFRYHQVFHSDFTLFLFANQPFLKYQSAEYYHHNLKVFNDDSLKIRSLKYFNNTFANENLKKELLKKNTKLSHFNLFSQGRGIKGSIIRLFYSKSTIYLILFCTILFFSFKIKQWHKYQKKSAIFYFCGFLSMSFSLGLLIHYEMIHDALIHDLGLINGLFFLGWVGGYQFNFKIRHLFIFLAVFMFVYLQLNTLIFIAGLFFILGMIQSIFYRYYSNKFLVQGKFLIKEDFLGSGFAALTSGLLLNLVGAGLFYVLWLLFLFILLVILCYHDSRLLLKE